MIMGIIEATTDAIETSLRGTLDNFKSVFDVLSLATGSPACATEYILN